MAGRREVNTLREAINEYVLLRRDLGFKLVNTQRWLCDFASFMEDQGALFITTEWEKDIKRLMKAADTLRPRGGLRGLTYSCLLGLLAVTGLRISEALTLRLDDVDLENGVLTIRKTKFGKSRLVPLHPSTQRVLLQFAQRRDAHRGRATITHFFVSERGKPLRALAVHRAFRILCHKIGLHASEGCDKPQLHHFRHRFATTTLLRWYRSTDDVERRLPLLSTFLGHVCISSTYWYMSAYPELMGQAVRRLEHRWEKFS
jgi:integrase